MKSIGPQDLSCLSDFKLNGKRPVFKNDTWAWSVPVCHFGFGHAWNHSWEGLEQHQSFQTCHAVPDGLGRHSQPSSKGLY